jgi:CIC family chloride channel protein
LAQKGQLMTHNADSNILKMMDVKSLLECNFEKLNPNQKLKDLVNAIQVSNRNIFPVVDEEDRFLGMVMMEDIRKIIFKQHLYNTTLVKELMIRPEVTIKQEETMNSIASKLHKTSMYNIPVLDETGKYLGFVSRANVFSEYRKLLQDFSTE